MTDLWSVILAWEGCGLVMLAWWAKRHCAVRLDALILFMAGGLITLALFSVVAALERAEKITLWKKDS